MCGTLASSVSERWWVSPTCCANTTSRWGLTVLQDQQLGGVIMWVPSALVFIAIGLMLFAKWLAESDRRVKLGGMEAALQESRKQL